METAKTLPYEPLTIISEAKIYSYDYKSRELYPIKSEDESWVCGLQKTKLLKLSRYSGNQAPCSKSA
jgi:hypothetical protein